MPNLHNLEFSKNNYFTIPRLSKRANNVWIIEYYVQNDDNKLVRKRQRVKPITPVKARNELAKDMIHNLLVKLRDGWNPERKNRDRNGNLLLVAALDKYWSHIEDKYKVGNLRHDTRRTYKSKVNLFKQWVLKHFPKASLYDFDIQLCRKYLNYLVYERNLSNTYANNCRNHLRIFGNYLIDQNMKEKNPATKIKTLKSEEKSRTIIPENDLKKILLDIQKNDPQYYVLCLLLYLCFIRPTELTKLKVRDVKLSKSVIVLPGKVTKNKREDIITLPNIVCEVLQKHIEDSHLDNYLFSNNGFKPGTEKLKSPKPIRLCWIRYREKLNLSDTYHLYSLKDTGITRLFYLGIPIQKIKNQARHSDIKTTQLYVPKSMMADEEMKNLKLF